MLDEGNEREELNLDMAFAPRTQSENANRTGRMKAENAHYVRRTKHETEHRTGEVQLENVYPDRRTQSVEGHRTGRLQSENERHAESVKSGQEKKNSRERRKQAEKEYRARRKRSEDEYNIDGMRIERQHRTGKMLSENEQGIKRTQPENEHRAWKGQLDNEQRTKTGHCKVRSKKSEKRFFRLLLAEVFFILLAAVLIISVIRLLSDGKAAQAVKNLQRQISVLDYKNVGKPEWEEVFLTPNEYSRPGERLPEVNSIFVHYTANRNTSAAQNRSYFESLKDTHERSASAHFIIGYDGEIIQCIPFEEIAYAVKTRNYDSISIECCYKSADGSFTKETYDSLIHLLAYLVKKYGLSTDDILRHYDCGGKKCPLYYVEHEDDWEQLKRDVEKLLK